MKNAKRMHEALGSLGMVFMSGGIFGALCGLIWPLAGRVRLGLLFALLAGVSMVTAAVHASRVKA